MILHHLFVMPYLAKKFIPKVYRPPEDSGKKKQPESKKQENNKIGRQ